MSHLPTLPGSPETGKPESFREYIAVPISGQERDKKRTRIKQVEAKGCV